MRRPVPLCTCFLAFAVFLAAGCGDGAQATQLLGNPGFEEDSQHEVEPFPPWLLDHDPDHAGAVTTSTAARTGIFGLWTYTHEGSEWSFSSAYQTIEASPGQVHQGGAWVRTAPVGGEGTWMNGSFAKVRVAFLDASHSTLASHNSDSLTSAETPWTECSVLTDPAPEGTAWVKFILHLEKPDGATGQSVANFDDCYLEEMPAPILWVSKRALGFGLFRETLTLCIENHGTGTVTWDISQDADWILLSTTSGTTTSETDTITVAVDRSGLPPDVLTFHGHLHVTSDGGAADIDVYMEHIEPYPVPAEPSLVWTDGYRLMIQRRLPDGSLDEPRRRPILGACWSPASIGTPADAFARIAEFAEWYELDIQMLREMHGNAVYTFLDFDTTQTAFDILDYLYYNDVMAIVTVDLDGTYDLDRLDLIVNAYKNHPAVLMWAIGNEWNINLYHDQFTDLWEAAHATEAAAQRVKGIDLHHAVASIYGEIILPNQPLAVTDSIINSICPTVDVWGLNIYRGESFGILFDEWASIAAKPMFISEYGTDSFFSTGWWDGRRWNVDGYVDETMQAEFNHGLWIEIAENLSAGWTSSVCSGGTVFEWCDEWWKTGDPWIHEPDGYETSWNPDAFPDGFANEEFFGIVNIDRTTKESYSQFRLDFDHLLSAVDTRDARPHVCDSCAFGLAYGWNGGLVTADRPAQMLLTLRTPSRVEVRILDVLGRLVRVLVTGDLPEGSQELQWNASDGRGREVDPGVYFCQAVVDGQAKTLKILVARQ